MFENGAAYGVPWIFMHARLQLGDSKSGTIPRVTWLPGLSAPCKLLRRQGKG